MGLLDEDGNPKRACWQFADYTPSLGICQWFHFEDPRLENAVEWLSRLGVKYVRTGLSWSDAERPNYEQWFDRLMSLIEPSGLIVRAAMSLILTRFRYGMSILLCLSRPRSVKILIRT